VSTGAKCTKSKLTFLGEVLALADQVLVLDGKGSLNVQSNAKDLVSDKALMEKLRQSKAIITDDDSQGEDPVSGEVATPQEPKAPTQPNDVKKLDRQRGDLGLYRFYILSSGLWKYLAWMLMAAINMLWSQMPCMALIPARFISFLMPYLQTSSFEFGSARPLTIRHILPDTPHSG
jgi:hypothetical protein